MPKAASNKKVDKKSVTSKSTADKVTISNKQTAPKQALESIKAKGNILRKYLPILTVIVVAALSAIAIAGGKQPNQSPIAIDSPDKVNKTVLATASENSGSEREGDVTDDKQSISNNPLSVTKTTTPSSSAAIAQPSASTSLQPANNPSASDNTNASSNSAPVIQPPHETPIDQPSGHGPSEPAKPIAGTVSNLVYNTLLLDLGSNINLQVL